MNSRLDDAVMTPVSDFDAGMDSREFVSTSRGARIAHVARAVCTHPAFVVIVPLLTVLVVQLFISGRYVPRFDLAGQELAVQEAAHGQRLVGPYSHFGWEHPGPMLFYAVVPWYRALGNNGGLAMVLTRLALDAVCAALVVVLVDRIAGRACAWGAAAGVAWFELRVGLNWFRDPWNPWAVVLPLALALVAGASLMDGRGRRWRALVLVVAASFAVQSHVGSAPLAALALVVGAFGFIRSARAGPARRVMLDIALVALTILACWSLPLWQEATSRHGNLTDLAAFFTSPASDTPGLDVVAKPVTAAVTLPFTHMGFMLGPEPLADVNHWGAEWWFVGGALLAASVGAAVMWWRARRPAAAALAASVPAGTVVALVSALGIRGGVSPYLFSPDLAVAFVAWMVVAMAAAQLASRWSRRPTLTIAAVGTVAVVLTGLVLVIGADAFDRVDTAQASDTAVALTPAVHEVCRSNRSVNVTSLDVQWYDTLAVAAALGECAPDVKIDPGLAYIVGARRAERSPGLPVLVAATTTPAPKGWELVGRAPAVSLYVHNRAALR